MKTLLKMLKEIESLKETNPKRAHELLKDALDRSTKILRGFLTPEVQNFEYLTRSLYHMWHEVPTTKKIDASELRNNIFNLEHDVIPNEKKMKKMTG